MISIVITSFNEPNVKKAIIKILESNIKEKYELVVVAPDKETENLVTQLQKKKSQLKFFKDPGKGKSFALNLVFKILNGRIWLFTDGDVYLDKNAINNILKYFDDKKVGCVTGRPVSLNSRKTILGYWSHLLFEAGAHKVRKDLDLKNEFLEGTGYLFAFRNNITRNVPLNVAEDSIIPYLTTKKGYRVRYAGDAFVYVKNPTTLRDFVSQKIRTAKSHESLETYAPFFPKVKSFKNEVKIGTLRALKYPKNLKEFFWTLLLFFVRFSIWVKVKLDENLLKKKYSDGWERIESTK